MKIDVTITNKIVENMMKHSSVFRDKDALKSHLLYRFNDDVMFTSLINQIKENEDFYVFDYIFDICYFIHKTTKYTYDILYCRFDDDNISKIKNRKGIEIIPSNSTIYNPIIIGTKRKW